MTDRISDHMLDQFSAFITARFGLHYPRTRRRDLERRIAAIADHFGHADGASCIDWLTSARLTRDQFDTIARHLTIGETYFFREPQSFELLAADILPTLIASRRGRDQRLRIWSAGCSTGEEPYSLAILLKRMLPDLPKWHVTILATDINADSLARAARGEYGDWSFRGAPPWLKSGYFTQNRQGRFEIAAAIRKMVTFAPLNLAQDPYPSLLNNTNAMDLIFCRNVLMYFAPHQAEQAVAGFHQSLVAGGWLVVSPCETSSTLFGEFAAVHARNAVFYRKDGQRGAAVAPVSAAAGAMALLLPPVTAAQPQPDPPPMAPPQPPLPVPAAAAALAQEEPRLSPYEEAQALYRQGLFADAATRLAEFLADGAKGHASSPSFGKAAVLLARLLANQGNLATALDWLEKAIAASKLDPEARYLQAMIFQEQGATDAAVAALKRTLYLDQHFVLAHFALANLSLQRGRAKEAARHLENAAALLAGYGPEDMLPGSDGMSARRLGEIIAATMVRAAG
ncbi:MAG: chemotaxis protein CheR [Geobacteraceae bacterium]|nr:chemotaxis protein CheR [Geobacteraceae bacterium]